MGILKLVIADRLAIYVNSVYNNTDHHSGFSFFVATIFFAFQIYCDFSAYSDIAIGVSKVMGFHLMTNFNRPYFARNVAEFWKRWHISLSTWFKDYLYFSMGGNKVSIPRWYFNLFMVFLISGLWHGAQWTYIIWGALNGFYLIFGNLTLNFRTKFEKAIGLTNLPNLARFIQISVTFLLICFSWIFFRANTFNDALLIIKKISTLQGPLFIENPSKMIYSLAAISTLLLIEYKREYYKGSVSFFNNKYWIIRNMSYASLVIVILLFGVFDGGQFIYFQF